MGLRERLEALRPRFTEGGKHARYRPVYEMVDHFFYSHAGVTRSGPHVRDTVSVQRIMMYFVLATLPAWFFGIWHLGHSSNVAMAALSVDAAPGWRGDFLSYFGYDPEDAIACFMHGLAYFVPILLMALAVAVFWETAFATLRGRRVDEDVFPTVWLYALILPATTPMYQVAVGMTFGLIIGKLIFGGTGRYIVHPSLLGVTFLFFAYPALVFGDGAWVPVEGFSRPTALELAAQGGLAAIQDAGITWWQLFVGDRQGSVGIVSSLGCAIGALFLIVTGMASWRIMLGVLIGTVATVLLFQFFCAACGDETPWFTVPWYWHLVLGGFAYGAVFLAPDPVASAMTNAGRWIFGVLVGLLTVVVRLTNPSYNEGIVFAILLAAMFSPLIDFFVVEQNIRRRQRRLAREQT